MTTIVNRISISLLVIIFFISSPGSSDGKTNYEVAKIFMDSYVKIYQNSKGVDRERRISDLKIQYADKIAKLPGDIQVDISIWQIKYSFCYQYYIKTGNSFCTEAREIKRIYDSDNPTKIRKATELKKKALALYKNGEYTDCQRALEYYDDAISFDRKNAELYSNRAIVYGKLGKHQKAIKDLGKAINIRPDMLNYHNYLLRGLQYFIIQKYTKALRDFEKAITLEPKNAKDYSYRGATYYKLKEIDHACNDARKACELGDCGLIDNLTKNDICS